jgi:hypothetical protein
LTWNIIIASYFLVLLLNRRPSVHVGFAADANRSHLIPYTVSSGINSRNQRLIDTNKTSSEAGVRVWRYGEALKDGCRLITPQSLKISF